VARLRLTRPAAGPRQAGRRPPRAALLAGAVAGALGVLLLAGRLAGPVPAPAPPGPVPAPAPRPVDLRGSCDPGGVGRATHAPSDGPEPHPRVPGLTLRPTGPAARDLPRDRALALALARVDAGAQRSAHARRFRVSSAGARLHDRRAWVVAVAGVPLGMGYCGPLGTREVVVVLDARSGAELLRYSYR
jgi:hypothetical protein